MKLATNNLKSIAAVAIAICVASQAMADLNGEVVLTGAGSYDVQTQAFQADIDIQRADMGFLSSRMAAPGAGELNRYGGSITGQATIVRASGQEPIVSNGSLLARGLTVDGRALLEKDATARWTETVSAAPVQYRPPRLFSRAWNKFNQQADFT